MIAIVLTAVGVLGAVYVMHLIARSPRVRARFRRRAFAVVAGVYGVRRQLGYRFHRVASGADRRLRPVARRGVRRVREWAAARQLRGVRADLRPVSDRRQPAGGRTGSEAPW